MARIDRAKLAMVADSLRAGTIIDTNRPDSGGVSLRLGFRRASRGKVKNGKSHGRAGSRSRRTAGAPGYFTDFATA